MATLTVWRYDTVDGAGAAAALLKKLALKDALVLHDAATVLRVSTVSKGQQHAHTHL